MNFFSRYKKLFIIIIFLGISALIGYFIWSVFFRETPGPIIVDEQGRVISGLPETATGTRDIIDPDQEGDLPIDPGIAQPPRPGDIDSIASGGLTQTERLSSDRTLSPTLTSDGSLRYYNQNDGKFYNIDKEGNLVSISDTVFHSVENVTWAPNSDKAILEYPDGRKILYNFETEKQSTIPSHWEDFSFSPEGGQLISKSIGLDSSNSWLVVSNDDSSRATAIEHIGNNHDTVYPSWSPAQQIVGLYTGGVDFNRQEIFFIGQNNENFKSTVIEGRGLEFQWSTEGDKLLYSVWNSSDNLNPRLWIVNASPDNIGQSRRSLDLATWSDKCTFATNDDVYCAVPRSLPQGAGLFPELADQTEDYLYKINLATGARQLLAIPDNAYNISDIMVPENQDVLYFTDKQSGQLYKIDLK